MKNTSNLIIRIATVTGFALGAFALSTAANWVAPNHAPPRCDSGDPGCDAPLHVGNVAQGKLGSMAVGKSSPSIDYTLDVNGFGYFGGLYVAGGFNLKNSSATALNRVLTLTNVTTGATEWRDPASVSVPVGSQVYQCPTVVAATGCTSACIGQITTSAGASCTYTRSNPNIPGSTCAQGQQNVSPACTSIGHLMQ